MSTAKGQGNALWIAIVAALAIAALILLVLLNVRLPGTNPSKPGNTANTPGVVGITRIDRNLLSQVELYDPKPLFLPTAINNSAPTLPADFRREPGRALRALPPALTNREYEMKVVLPEPVQVPSDTLQALRVGDEPMPYFSLGKINYPYTPLSPRLAYLEVQNTRTGRTLLAAPLTAQPDKALPTVDWQPLEMIAAIEASGLVGEPTVTSGSGFEEVDRYFLELLHKHFRLGSRLPPGFYTLRVGP